MKFRFEYMTQTQIGKLFGVSSHVVGKWLSEVGWRHEKSPTQAANEVGAVHLSVTDTGAPLVCWHAELTVGKFIHAGHRLVATPPRALMSPPTLAGPFRAVEVPDGTWQLLNDENATVAVVNGAENANFLMRVLNVAEKSGAIGRCMTGLS